MLSKLSKIFTAGALSLTLFASSAAANELSLIGNSPYPLTFVPSKNVVEKQTIRLYTTVYNTAKVDLIGTVKFFVDGNQVATDQPVSVKAFGAPDEVFVVWKAVAGNHKVSAKLFPYEPEGDNPANNYVEKDLFVDWDTDGDGVGDNQDVDDDNDGLKDEKEKKIGTNPKNGDTDKDGANDLRDAFPTDPTEQKDTDGDGIGNNADTDDDNDGLEDVDEPAKKTDPLNPDTDGDGVENCNDSKDAFPTDKSECKDTDGDGVGDNADKFPGRYGESSDNDGDGIGDNADTDDDNDGTPDDKDVFPKDPTEQKDSDRDGLGDNADPNDNNHGPIISLAGGAERNVIVGAEEEFDASGSSDPDGNLVRFVWNFGDESEKEEGAKITHSFNRVGEFFGTVTVTDDAGEDRVLKFVVVAKNSAWLEKLLWIVLLILLLTFAYIFYDTIQRKKIQHGKKK